MCVGLHNYYLMHASVIDIITALIGFGCFEPLLTSVGRALCNGNMLACNNVVVLLQNESFLVSTVAR